MSEVLTTDDLHYIRKRFKTLDTRIRYLEERVATLEGAAASDDSSVNTSDDSNNGSYDDMKNKRNEIVHNETNEQKTENNKVNKDAMPRLARRTGNVVLKRKVDALSKSSSFTCNGPVEIEEASTQRGIYFIKRGDKRIDHKGCL